MNEEGNAVLEYVSIVDQPAIERDFMYFGKSRQFIFKVEDEEQRIVVGPAMVPHMRIPRVDETTGEVYAVFFSPETIAKAAELFLKQSRTGSQNTQHEDNATEDVYMIESWIKESKNDKSSDFGFSDMPIGTWFVKMRILDDEIWEQVKTGQFRGFSVEGDFELGAEHYESMDFSRVDYAELYVDLNSEEEKQQMDHIIRLLLIDEAQDN